MQEILNKDYKYTTSEQKFNSDINGLGTINLYDLNLLGGFLGIAEIPDETGDDGTDESGTPVYIYVGGVVRLWGGFFRTCVLCDPYLYGSRFPAFITNSFVL